MGTGIVLCVVFSIHLHFGMLLLYTVCFGKEQIPMIIKVYLDFEGSKEDLRRAYV
jgi:hypothetical protein